MDILTLFFLIILLLLSYSSAWINIPKEKAQHTSGLHLSEHLWLLHWINNKNSINGKRWRCWQCVTKSAIWSFVVWTSRWSRAQEAPSEFFSLKPVTFSQLLSSLAEGKRALSRCSRLITFLLYVHRNTKSNTVWMRMWGCVTNLVFTKLNRTLRGCWSSVESDICVPVRPQPKTSSKGEAMWVAWSATKGREEQVQHTQDGFSYLASLTPTLALSLSRLTKPLFQLDKSTQEGRRGEHGQVCWLQSGMFFKPRANYNIQEGQMKEIDDCVSAYELTAWAYNITASSFISRSDDSISFKSTCCSYLLLWCEFCSFTVSETDLAAN